jgi:putative molybdopterin biosynthesis protein
MVTVAHRNLGLIVPPGNPDEVRGLPDLARPELRLVTRQRGAGTRVWLEAMAQQIGLQIVPVGEEHTQTDVARAIAEERADVGPGIEAAARAYGLDFVFLTRERYDLVMRRDSWERVPVRRMAEWLGSAEASEAITALGGYDTSQSGLIQHL